MSQDYDLILSMKGLGKLNPVLKDKFGNVIDGFHRLQLDPDWPCMTLSFIDTAQKLEAARLATNTNRRTVTSEELTVRIGLLAKSGLKPEEIARMTGLSKTTVYKYYPQDLKDETKVKAGVESAISRSVPPAEHTVTTSDTPSATESVPNVNIMMARPQLVECERCHVTATDCKPWHNHNLCSKCFSRAELVPEAYEGYLRYLEKKRQHEVPTVKEPSPKALDTWEVRKAQMSPQHSKMEGSVIASLIESGVTGIVQDRHFCVLETIPDIYFPTHNLAIYLDGEVHNGKQDRDEQLRGFLRTRHGVRVFSYQYDSTSQKEVERVTKEILSVVKVEA